MSEEELLAEKIRAIIARNNARDVYDVWDLLQRNINVNKEFVEQKLNLLKNSYSKNLLIEKIEEKRNSWEKELRQLIISFPDFQIVFDEIIPFLD